MNLAIGIILSYFIGAIPTAYIWGKITKNIDIRKHGSGNVGATNVFRVLGKGAGISVLLIDIAKGVIPTVFIADFLSLGDTLLRMLLGLVAVCGHNWTIFLGFKGGKGIATSLGLLIGLAIKVAAFKIVLLLTVLVWILCFLLSRYVSLSSMLASIMLPIFMIINNLSFEMVMFGIFICLLVIFRHRPNIKRLLTGQEHRVPPFKRPF